MELTPCRSSFDAALASDLEGIAAAGLRRELRIVDSPQDRLIQVGGRTLLNFSSNDYLGLAHHPALAKAAIQAIEQYGTGSGASRLICGSLAAHHDLENALASFKGTEAALSFSSGYATALGVISALAGKDDVIVLDKLVHASIVDAARLSGAKLRVFRHNDLDDLASILAWADSRSSGEATSPGSARRPRTLVITESVFSMDGDVAPLREIVNLKEKHGAWLMVDEAHATGLFGELRRGVGEAQNVSEHIEVQMGTLGKAVGAAGGYVCGSRRLVDLLINRARSFIFSTAPLPAQSAAARAGIELIQGAEGEQRCASVWARRRQLGALLSRATRAEAAPPAIESAIVPIIIGPEEEAVSRAALLREAGFFVPAIRYPTVARGAARLRVTLTAAHSAEDVERLGAALKS